MQFNARVLNANLNCFGLTFALAVAFTGATVGFATNASAEQAIHEPSIAIEQGLNLEREHSWAEAIRHYDKHVRQFPEDRTLYQRLIISRLHYDVVRRYQDRSYLKTLDQLGAGQALDLYAEILGNLQSHYVDQVDWSRVFLHGTASLEVALTEQKFIDHHLATIDSQKIEQFRQTVHQRVSDRPTESRFDLRANAAFVAELAQKELGIAPTATVLEFVSGSVSTLDAYTRLLSGDQLDEMFSNIEGNFVGLGIELKSEADHLQILSVIPNGPAHEAGIVAGERITSVADAGTATEDSDYVADLLRGPEHSFVNITVVDKHNQPRNLRIQRRRVDVPCVENIHIVDQDNGVGYFRLTNFQKTTIREVESAYWNLQQQGMRSLIIDVRGNPGGLLSAAVEVADYFLSEGKIVTTRGRNVRENFDYFAHRAKTWNTIPLTVLIDRESASASEIFAGAIADSGRGLIVGETSYGKGSVQGIFRMQTSRFGLCLTTAKFYSPSGKAISRNGVQPNVEVQSTYIAARPNASGELTTDLQDAVLQRAIAEMSNNRSLISRRP